MSKVRRIEALEAKRAAEEAAWKQAEQALLMRVVGTMPHHSQERLFELARLIGGAATEEQAAAHFEPLMGWEDGSSEPWPAGLEEWAAAFMGRDFPDTAPPPADPEAWAAFLKRAAAHTAQAARDAQEPGLRLALERLTAYRLFLAALLEDWRAQNPMTDSPSQ